MAAPIIVKIKEFQQAHVGSIGFYGESSSTKVNSSISYEVDGCTYGFRAPSFEGFNTIQDCVPLLKKQVVLNELLEEIGCDTFSQHENIPTPVMDGEKWEFFCISEFMQNPHHFSNGEDVMVALQEIADKLYIVEVA